MEIFNSFLHYFLHLDHYLQEFITLYGHWTYVLLLLIIFCESGLIVTPFLPGDSLLFAAGSLCAITSLDVHFLTFLLISASLLGVTVNYHVGIFFGAKLFSKPQARILKPAYLLKTQLFYEKHGGKALIIGRFLPIIRTFIPFVAGIARMNYSRFMFFNVLGAVIWIAGILYLSYFFGNIPIVKDNFSFVVLGIIVVSLMPAGVPFFDTSFS